MDVFFLWDVQGRVLVRPLWFLGESLSATSRTLCRKILYTAGESLRSCCEGSNGTKRNGLSSWIGEIRLVQLQSCKLKPLAEAVTVDSPVGLPGQTAEQDP